MKTGFGQPVVAAVSAIDENRWGFHQFPALSRLPDGNILLMWADAADASETHGQPAPALVSSDQGRTWNPFTGQPAPRRPHFTISEIFDGEYLVMPSQPYFNVVTNRISLPDPVSVANVYGKRMCYRVDDLPATVHDYYRHIPAQRWSPSTRQWQNDRVTYDLNGLLAWKREGSDLLPRTFFERSLLKHGRELLYADYRAQYSLPDGRVTPKGGSHLMVSNDNGHTFLRRSTIAADLAGNDLYGEPHLAPTSDGRLVCVIRKTDQVQKPMAITWSSDNGQTWTPVHELFEFGVWPCIIRLECGTMVLSYGRPGVHLRFDSTGSGEHWSDPATLIEGSHREVTRHSCGYTSLLPVSDHAFLIAYSDFNHLDATGSRRKAILVQPVTVTP